MAGRDGSKLFVGSLPNDITEEELRMVFSTYGEVTNIHIIQSKSQTGHGCAFVTYVKKESAEDAISVLHRVYKIREGAPESIEVSWAKAPDAAAAAGGWANKGEGKGWKGDSKGGSKGGFEAWSAPPAWGASSWDKGGGGAGAWGGDGGWGKGWDKGGYGKGKGGGDKGGGGAPASSSGVRLFVGNLPSDVDDAALDYVFGNYGKVAKVHVMTGRARSGQACAFVEYSNSTEAETAILTLHEKYEIRPGDGPILVKHANAGGGKDRAAPY